MSQISRQPQVVLHLVLVCAVCSKFDGVCRMPHGSLASLSRLVKLLISPQDTLAVTDTQTGSSKKDLPILIS